jgi:hypothetical protein
MSDDIKCTHYWTVTSECPKCLRAELDGLKEENKKLQEELALMKKAFEVSYRMLGDKP